MTRLLLTLHDADGPLEVGVVIGRVAVLVPTNDAAALGSMDPARLTTGPAVGAEGAGLAAAAVLVRVRGRLWVGVGGLGGGGAASVALSFWSLSDVAGHWDRLLLQAWADGAPVQEGSVPAAREVMAAVAGLEEGAAMVAAPAWDRGVSARRSAFGLEDPVLGRSIRHEVGLAEAVVD